MGQYFYIVNLDKGEMLHPHKLNDGLKLGELDGSARALAMMCASGEGVDGPWCGDRIAVIGDYESDPDLLAAREEAVDVSHQAREALQKRFPWLKF